VAEFGGAVAAIEQGFQKAEIERSAYRIAREVDAGERKVVGVNAFVSEQEEPYEPLRLDPAIEQEQAARLADLRNRRDSADVRRRLDDIKRVAGTGENLLYPLRSALQALATIGEVSDALREVWGVYRPSEVY
jgi:methylmalonyl-CoA mutase N-terminal domain/subunit